MSSLRLIVFGIVFSMCYVTLWAQEAEPVEKITIADEPRTVDPTTAMPNPLAKKVTADLSVSSISEVAEWLRKEQDLVVLVEENVLSAAGVFVTDPVSDRLDDEPLYLMLNRLRQVNVAWYFEDSILHLTSMKENQVIRATTPYNIGDLIDAGYEADMLIQTISRCVSPESWEDDGGDGTLSVLGDVIFIRNTENVNRQIQGLLTAFRKHGRQTYVLDPVEHGLFRNKLAEEVSVTYEDTPLDAAVDALAKKTKAGIRLDMPALRAARVREREPVSLSLSNRKLSTVLQSMLIDLDLTWVLRDGVLWITTNDGAESLMKTAVYDVRDLCRNMDESFALSDALSSQTHESWEENGGSGSLRFARPGTLVIHNRESVHNEVATLLEAYRTALRASKPRVDPKKDPNEVTTVYYKMHSEIAKGLSGLLPRLVPESKWKGDDAGGVGEVLMVASSPETSFGETEALIDQSVLIVKQTRGIHEKISEVIHRVTDGDVNGKGMMMNGGGMGGGMGGSMGGGGGFGGGFFSIPSDTVINSRD